MGGSQLPPMNFFIGGHGSVDTLPILMAIARPGGAGKQLQRAVRIGDLATTAASLFGLTLRSTTVGADLSSDL
jgi:hypothetical protein